MRQTTFGGRYVTAEDVARCMETFNACIHGGASPGGGNPVPPGSGSPQGGSSATPTATTTTSGTQGTSGGGSGTHGGKALPQHFGIMYEGAVAIDCRVDGDTVTCTDTPVPLPETMDSRTGQVIGKLSGSTMTGTRKIRTQAHYITAPGCVEVGEGSGPVTYVFGSDGTVKMSEGPMSWLTTRSGDCSGSDSRTNPATEGSATWSALG